MGNYILGTTYTSTVGLNLQHSLVRKALGEQLLEPHIPYQDANLLIADIPCGTCMWLIDLASQVDPSTVLRGFDLNLGQGPPTGWLPSNIKDVTRLDLFEPIPDDLVGKYDVVHVSLVVCFVDDESVSAVAKNIMTLLKPGGHIQWVEMALDETTFESAIPGYIPEALPRAASKTWQISEWKCPKWVNDLDSILSESGYTHVTKRVPVIDRALGRAFADGELLGMLPIAATAQKDRPDLVVDMNEFEGVVRDAFIETAEKQVGCFPKIVVVTARKSL